MKDQNQKKKKYITNPLFSQLLPMMEKMTLIDYWSVSNINHAQKQTTQNPQSKYSNYQANSLNDGWNT